MSSLHLLSLVSSDIPQWKREILDELFIALKAYGEVSVVDINATGTLPGKLPQANVIWLVGIDSARVLRAFEKITEKKSGGRLFLSIIGPAPVNALPALFWNRLRRVVPPHVQLLTHSPLNHQFYRLVEGIDQERLHELSFPVPIKTPKRQPKPVSEGISIGTFSSMRVDGNLNYLLSVAHYVIRAQAGIRFRIVGAGPLLGHVRSMAEELGIGADVDVVQSFDASEITGLDVFVYTPAHNYHFMPLLLAASQGLTVISSDLQGVEQYIQDGHDGFLVPVNETKPMAELILRAANDPAMREALGTRLKRKLSERFSAPLLAARYANLFFGTALSLKEAVGV